MKGCPGSSLDPTECWTLSAGKGDWCRALYEWNGARFLPSDKSKATSMEPVNMALFGKRVLKMQLS